MYSKAQSAIDAKMLQVGRSSMNFDARMPGKNAPAIEAMHTLSGQYSRFGSRRIRVMLAREGILVARKPLTKISLRADYRRQHGLSHRKWVSLPRLWT